jgi:N-methylhydantoinase B
MYHEGLLLPPVKIFAGGQREPDIERVILANSRQPELMRGDIHAQIAVTQMGAARVAELCERFGARTVTDAFAAILKGAADELRAAIAKLPEGETSAEGFLDSDGIVVDKPIKLAVTVTIEDGVAHFDFTNCDPQARGPVNLRPPMVEACVFYSLIGCLGPDLAFNDGVRNAVRVVLKPRTVVNADPPGSVSNYQVVNLKLIDVILEALAHFNPARALANSGSSSVITAAWSKGRPGQATLQYEIMGAAYGGGLNHDGTTATATHLSNLHIAPIEILESEFPCRITRFAFVPDSGGAGEWRGGLSLQREYEVLEDAAIVRRFDKARFPPGGLAGGKPGTAARFITKLGTPDERDTPPGRYDMKAGDRFLLQSAGGGGYGDPAKRDPAALARDIAEGYVTAAGAAKDYGG